MTKKSTKKKVSKKVSSKKVSSGDANNAATPATPTPAINQEAFMEAVAAMFGVEEREALIQEHMLHKLAADAWNMIYTGLTSLGIAAEFSDDDDQPTGYIISQDGRILPIDRATFDAEYNDIQAEMEAEDGEEESDVDDLIESLKEYMENNGETQASIAKQLGASQATVSLWLRGESHPRSNYVEAINALIF